MIIVYLLMTSQYVKLHQKDVKVTSLSKIVSSKREIFKKAKGLYYMVREPFEFTKFIDNLPTFKMLTKTRRRTTTTKKKKNIMECGSRCSNILKYKTKIEESNRKEKRKVVQSQ